MKRINILIGFILMLLTASLNAQDKFFTKSGKISFYSDAPTEKIEAINKSVSCVLDTKSGMLQFVVLMKGFEFKKALMQEHFNENYVESDQYPKATFRGQIINNAAINYTKDGIYEASVKGRLNIHGQEKDIEAKGSITVSGGSVTAASGFNVQVSDYKIGIPAIMKDKIAETVKINVSCLMTAL